MCRIYIKGGKPLKVIGFLEKEIIRNCISGEIVIELSRTLVDAQMHRISNWGYIGCTENLSKRFDEHNKGLVFSTKHRRPLELIYFEACRNKDGAYRRERYLKTGIGKRYLRDRLRGALQQSVTPQGGLTG